MPAIPFSQSLNIRQSTVVIPTTYSSLDSSPQPGVVAGIVLASVGGFLLLLALLYSCLGWAPIAIPTSALSDGTSTVASRSVLSFRTRSTKKTRQPQHHQRRRAQKVRATEMYEVRTSQRVSRDEGPPVIVVPGPSRPTPRPPPAPRTVTVSDDSEDEVVVIEEHSPPRRSSRRSDERRYRDSDRDSRRDSRR